MIVQLAVMGVVGQVVAMMVAFVGARGHGTTEDFISDLDKPVPTAFVQGVLGKKAILPCDTQAFTVEDHVSMVLWFKESDGEPLYSYDVRGRQATQPKLWSSPSGFGSRAFFRASANPSVLLIDSVTPSDAGVYRCRVDFKNSPTRNMRLNFTVIAPPEKPVIVDAKTRDQTRLLEPYNEGDTIELICEVKGGDPPPRVTWYLENVVIDDSFERRADGVTVNTLTFPSVGRQHLNARLVCQAANTNLSMPTSKLVILDINLKPLSVQILNKSRQLSADRAVEVECQSTGSRPEAQLTWWKGNRQLKRGIKIFSKTNVTTSLLSLIPEAEDHELYLSCRADNPRVQHAVVEDRWWLNVHYVPIATLKMGSSLNPRHIEEGDDLYFECSVKANPKIHRLTWYKGDTEIQQNPIGGIILSDQSLVIQRVSRTAAGDYSCLAQNTEGSAASNPLSLQVKYAPECANAEDSSVHGALKGETIQLRCEVDSSPEPANFTWTFNGASGTQTLNESFYSNSGFDSVLNYTPVKDSDYGTVFCVAANLVGQQKVPCVFKVVAAGKPNAPQNCSILGHNAAALTVECVEGFDGGLPQTFFMEVLELPSLLMRANVTSNHTPSFEVLGLDKGSSYALTVFAANPKGRGDTVTLYTVPLRSPDKYVGATAPLPLSPMLASLLAVAALLCAGVCGVIIALYRRHTRQRDDKHPPVDNTLYKERSVDSLSKGDTATYCASPKMDYQYELKVDTAEAESDPDVIPYLYDKKPTPISEGYVHRIYNDQPLNVPSSVAALGGGLVNRGVTARSVDIAAARNRPEVVTTQGKVRESCI